MTKQSIVLLITSIILFIFGIITTISTIVILEFNILVVDNTYPALRFVLGILFIMIIAFFVTISIRAYGYHFEAKLSKEQYNMVKLDNLTQMYNFDYFITLLQTVEAPFSLVMLDLDNFKEINDKFGSVIGDLVLKVIAKSIKESIRINDIVARYQGDAFLIVLKNASPQNAVALMTLIRNNIKHNEKLSEKNIELSTSVGIQFVSQKGSTEVLFRNIVEALCIAKANSGDNKVVLHDKIPFSKE